MEPALDMMHRALHGDAGARAFLERTSSIYMLDVTDKSKPKTYGCWNFIHQCMNEVERYELNHSSPTSVSLAGAPNTAAAAPLVVPPALVSHVRLLATMALRVARRCPSTDKALIMTCISNYSEQYEGGKRESVEQWLIDLNLELREIVMGRIAAMAFDFGFHDPRRRQRTLSAFADPVVMDTFCAILSANAVSSGPAAIRHFATEWIVPSSKNLPSFAVASVVLHLALEGNRKTAAAGTKDILQQLSMPIFSVVLVPILSDAVAENSSRSSGSSSHSSLEEDQQQQQHPKFNPEALTHETSSQLAAMCIRATTAWCEATDLSLPQIKHICSKVNIHFVSVISDAMYSDCPVVVDSLAALMESIVLPAQEKPVTEELMNQVRYIIQVDESLFHSRFTAQQLRTIEAREMETIVEDLLSSVGLQRFRFTERQHIGDHDVCRNLARIASAVCLTWVNLTSDPITQKLDRGVVQLLHKASGHPSVHISALSLGALAQAVRKGFTQSCDMLPILQRRAIIPHRYIHGKLCLTLEDVWSVSFLEFFNFRNDVLRQALLICYTIDGKNYVDSCLSAVEEFCCQQPSSELSLQLEAALFCIEVVAEEALDSNMPFPFSEQMKRCTQCLAYQPITLTTNPITSARMCRLIRKFSRWYADEEGLSVATDLVASTLLRATKQTDNRPLQNEALEVEMTEIGEASAALEVLFTVDPEFYIREENTRTLRDVWDASCSDRQRSSSVDVRLAIGKGVCTVLAALPDGKSLTAFNELASRVWESLEVALQATRASEGTLNFQANVKRLSSEIRLLSMLPRAYTDAGTSEKDKMESGCNTSPDSHAAIPVEVLATIKRGWSSLVFAANNYQQHEELSEAIFGLFCNLIPPSFDNEANKSLLRELCSATKSMLKTVDGHMSLDPLFTFLERFVEIFGEKVEQNATAAVQGVAMSHNDMEICRLLEELILETIDAARPTLGSAWSIPREQLNGQPAFESKPAPAPKAKLLPNESLGGMLSFLKQCLDFCPVFLQHLPAGPGLDKDDDLLLRRAKDAAVASLCDMDPALARCAMTFLLSALAHTTSPNDALRAFMVEEIARICGQAISLLVLGLCGNFNHDVTDDASLLLHTLLRSLPPTEMETRAVAALRQDCFRLGDPCRIATLAVFGRCAQNLLSVDDLTMFLEQVWELHQVEDADALPNSDTTVRFLRRFTT